MTDFYSVSHVVFGRGEIRRLPDLVARLGRRPAIIANGPHENIARVQALLPETLVVRQKGEPTVHDIDRALHAVNAHGADVVIGLGGGSAIDAAKAVAALLTNGGAVLDYMEVVGLGKKIHTAAAPWIAIPCTAGTGAEATRNAVIGFPEKKFKASLRSELILPRTALIDPELGVPVPPDVTASSGMDALCQCIEAFTSTGASPLTDPLALEGITRAARSLARAFADGADLAAREDMALAAYLSGVALTNAGLGAVHGFAAAIGAAFPAPHGTICAALLPHVMAANIAAAAALDPAHPVLTRYAAVGRALLPSAPRDDAAAMHAGVDFVRGLCRSLHIARLGGFGLAAPDIAGVVAGARKSSSMRFNPVSLPPETLESTLQLAL